VGSSRPIPIDVRIITATNLSLEEMIVERTFREDLYYRINAIQMEIPPLRERPDDIPVLAEFFLRKYNKQYHKEELKLGEKALASLMKHNWPGNIRELEHSLEKGVILSEKEVIKPEHLFPRSSTMKETGALNSLNLEENEKFIIEKVIRREGGNVTSAARLLGINRSTLYQKMKKYGI